MGCCPFWPLNYFCLSVCGLVNDPNIRGPCHLHSKIFYNNLHQLFRQDWILFVTFFQISYILELKHKSKPHYVRKHSKYGPHKSKNTLFEVSRVKHPHFYDLTRTGNCGQPSWHSIRGHIKVDAYTMLGDRS